MNMSLEDSVREVCSSLTSVRATERKKSANSLKDYLTRNAVPSMLTNNTKKKSGYNWNHVFDDINDFIMKETEKYETAKSFQTVTEPLCTSLLHLCVAGSNKGCVYIKCQKILDACLNVLNDSYRRKAIGDAYLTLLYKHILPVENYLGFISPANWDSLLDIVTETCLTNVSSLDDLVKIKLLWLIIKNATRYCQFITSLRDSLTKLKGCCIKGLHDKKAQEFTVQIVILLFESLSTESRLTTCEFSESILPNLFKLYEQSMEEKRKFLLFRLFKIAIEIHHPLGRIQNKNGTMAHSWALWNKHLHSILEIVCLEINSIQKIRKQNDVSMNCDYFYDVAAVVFYQVFSMPEKENEEESGNAAKKQKSSFNKNKSFNDLVEELRLNPIPWIGIIHIYVKNFHDSICYADFITLLIVLEKTMSDNSKCVNWDRFEYLTCLTIKSILSHSDHMDHSNDEVIQSLWKTCVRNAAVTSGAQKSIHTIMQVILQLVPLKYQNVQPLLISYIEKGMPVDDHSLKTLNSIFHKFYRKSSYLDIRQKCFTWLRHGNMACLDTMILNEFLLRLLCNENLPINENCDTGKHEVYEIIFSSLDKSILYSEFECSVTKTQNATTENTLEKYEINPEMYNVILDYFEQTLSQNTRALKQNVMVPIEYAKFVRIVIKLLDSFLKYNLTNNLKGTVLYSKLRIALKYLYAALTKALKSNYQIRDKILLLKCVQNILLEEYEPMINTEIREHIEEDCFHSLNDVIKRENFSDDADNYDESEVEFSDVGLKENCIYLLGAYCRKQTCYTNEVLKCILDRDVFTLSFNIQCPFKCIELLNDRTVESVPLELIFTLMQTMCKVLFRDPKASRDLLKILSGLLEQIWCQNDDIMRKNCAIMVKSYLTRCTDNFYPPGVAALIYECVAKIIQLDNSQDPDLEKYFKRTLIDKIAEGSEHKLRIYCSHLLSLIATQFSDYDVQQLSDSLLKIFVINLSEQNETILKDEISNRTATVLHSFYSLATVKTITIHKTILTLIQFQNEKPMENRMVKKVLNMVTEAVAGTSIDVYMNDNILRVLHYWFKENISFKKLPVHLFGYDDLGHFVEEQLKWILPADILLTHNGIVEDSNVLKYFKDRTNKSTEQIMEMCFCNIMALCLPYIVMEKYKLEEEKSFCVRYTANANRLFQITRQILKNEKWSNLFVENLGEIMLLCATNVSDHIGASELFQMPVVNSANPYAYSKRVFAAVLKYFGELIDGDIMQYMCENQPLVILNILFKIWNMVLREKIFNFKILHVHAYVSFIDNIPLGYTSDAILCNFSCGSIAHCIKVTQNIEEIKIYVGSLKIIMTKILNQSCKNSSLIQKSILPKVISILTIKMEEEFVAECKPFLGYLIDGTKSCVSKSIDVVDFVNLITKESQERRSCSSQVEFVDTLKIYKLNLDNPSHDTLSKLFEFLKQNDNFIKQLYADIDKKGFSELCNTSLVHQVIFALNNILKTANEEKIIIEACNCLAEIGTYDIKTLVTVPPMDTKRILEMSPKHYFALTVLRSLSENLFNEDPTVSNKIAKALSQLLKFRDGKAVLNISDDNAKFLQSLMSPNCEVYAEYKIDNVKFDECNAIEYLVPRRNEDHSLWITRITMALLNLVASNRNYIHSLQTVCTVKPSICGVIMPALMGLILDCSTEIHVGVFGEQINEFFKYIWNISYDDSLESSEFDSGSKVNVKISQDQKRIIQYLLDVIDFVRVQRSHYRTRTRMRTSDMMNYLNLEYLSVSWGAALAERPLTALYYGELWASANNGAAPPASPDAATTLLRGHDMQRIFRRCFVSIGEMDAVDGCGNAHLTSEREKRKHLINTGQFADALFLHDIALSRGAVDEDVLRGVVTSLHRSGMHHLALRYIKSYPENDELDDVKYDCLSYLGDWSDFVDTQELELKSKEGGNKWNSIIKAMRYACLKDCLNIRPAVEMETRLRIPLNRSKLAIAGLCQTLNMENCQNVYRIVSNLHLFRDIDSYFLVRCDKMTIPELLDHWQIVNLPPFNDFKYLEALISQRNLMLEHIAENYTSYLPKVHDLQLQYAELGLSNQRIQMAQRVVAAVKHHQSLNLVTLLESQISWAKGHKDIALSLLNEVVSKGSEEQKLTAMSLRQYGLWMAECKRENGRDIIHKYLEKSLQKLNGSDDIGTRLRVYSDIAKFADAEYKQIVSYMNSSVFENKVKCMEKMEGTVASLGSTQDRLTRDEKKALMTNNAFSKLDKAEIENTRTEKENFLKLAMRYYLLSLTRSDENNLTVFRVISLWVDNPGIDLEDPESGPLGQLLLAIPSWKFITVLPQLAPRLSNESTPFAHHLKQIIKTCAIEHPHHTLPILFNLKNSEKDQQICNKGSGSQTSSEPRLVAATALVKELAMEKNVLAVIIAQMEQICDATIKFAYYVPESKDLKPQPIPRTESISRLRDLDAIPIPTDTITIRKHCDYSQLSTVSSFEKCFELVGGINYPKKISCLSSDGKKRILLVKGEDDLRQDAVMQQVFNIVNSLLESNPITYRNKLIIRTYKVVPMSRRSGVLEWCEGTMPLGSYLTAAHVKYRPQDITPTIARTKLRECHENKRPTARKLEVFNEILKVFRPVFHYFFTEHYLDPVTWYERRLAYTRSVATSSMVGYILGLGDRHVQNILIDKTTAEVIHIDFGIAFDQGKVLPTPETIPFRLTQDIVAGFGSSGVEGIFRRCCEKTLQLLRDNEETLLTILEVLLCDPLYLWIVSTTSKAKAANARSKTTRGAGNTPASSGEGGGGLAGRALLAVRCKLCGAEGSAAGSVSVAGHVARLIHAATDPVNLCRLFHGWQPYL